MENKNNAELLIDLIQFNKKKIKLLDKISELEAKGIHDKEELDVINSYDVLYWFYNKYLTSINMTKREELLKLLLLINPKFNTTCDIMSIIVDSEDDIAYRKTISDLGATLLNLYTSDNKKESLQNQILKMMGYSIQIDTNENVPKINEYMVEDFSNMMLSVIEEDLKIITDTNAREALTKLKYNLIFIFDELEYRTTRDKFLSSNRINLTDEMTINTIGLTKDSYLNKCDKVFSAWLEQHILISVDRVYKNNLPTLAYPDHILIRTLANLINDKELCNCLILEPTDQMQENIRKATIMINNNLIKSYDVDSYSRNYIKV